MQRIFQRLSLLMMLTQASVCAGVTLDFSSGFAGSASSLNFNNAAQISGSKARLTNGAALQVGSVWSKNTVDIRKFSCQFTFQLTSASESGFTFTIQRAGNTVSGYPYDFLGFTPMSPSLALKFAFWPTGSTTGIYSNGAYPSYGSAATIHMDPTINLQSGHVFNVSLTYDGTTLHQTVTDTSNSATFSHDYSIDIVTTIDGNDAFVGFTGSTGSGGSSIQDILTWSYSVTASSYDVDFIAFPERLQVIPRNRTTNNAVVPVSGSEKMGGFSAAVLRVYRNGTQVGADQEQTLTYSGGSAPFSFSPTIPAELAHYDIELLLRNGSNQLFSVQRAQDIVAGDVIVIQGQSNALAKTISGSASAYTNPFIRTVGIESDWPSASTSSASWMVAIGDGTLGTDSLTDIGQWGLVMANQIVTANNIPVAIINAAFGGQEISFFQRNDALHDDVSTNYGRLLRRLQRAGIAGAVRTILFYQGESDKNAAAVHQAGFTALRSDWLQEYPSIEKLYVFQVRETNLSGPCSGDVARFNVDLRNRQRLFADQFPNLTLMSTTGLDGYEGCHYNFTNGYETLGFNMARMLQRDLYNGPSLLNTNPPNPAYAVLTGANKNLIRIPLRNKTDTVTFNAGATADFAVVGASVSIVSGSVVNGVLQLNLSGNANGATQVVYTGHTGPASGNWVANANGIGLLCFIEPLLVDTTPPVITLLGPNPVTVAQGGTYMEPGATASDNVDGDLTSSIVINSSAVNTAVPGDYPVTYNVSDVAGNAAVQVTRTVHVNANSSPTANAQSVTTNEDTAKAITLTGSDPNSDPLSFIVVTNPTHGALSGTAPNLTYTPAANYNGSDSFTFKVNDGTSDSNTATVSITVNPVNDAPTANAQSVTTNEDTAKGITLTGVDVDSGDTLTFSVVAPPTHGSLSGTPPNLTYTPATNYNGSDSLTFKANDGTVDSNIATVSITVDPVEDMPTISNMSDTSINEDAATGAISFTVGDAETASGSLTVSGTSSNTALVPNANIVFGGSGASRTVTITPAANKNGTTTITVSVNDGNNTTSDTFVLTVNAVNDAPTADGQSVATNQNAPKAITLTGSDTETPTGSLTFAVTVSPAHGTLTGTPPDLTYTPTTNYNGSDDFKFTVMDTGDGASPPLTSSEATVSITVNGLPEIAVEQPTGTGLNDGGSTVDFGSVVVDDDNSHTFTIRNVGAANLTGLGITVDGADSTEFTITAAPTASVLPGENTTFTVKFTPTAAGTRAAALHVASNDADENPFDIAVTGTGLTNLEGWRLQYFGSPEDSGNGADANDFDVDGLSNLLEFATGNDPTQSSAMPGQLNLNGDTIEFVYTRAKAAINDGFTFNVEWNDDVTSSNWSTAGVSELILSEDGTLQQVKASVSAGNGLRRFLHLKVTPP